MTKYEIILSIIAFIEIVLIIRQELISHKKNIEIESMKSKLERSNHITKAKYDLDLEFYTDITKCLTKLKTLTKSAEMSSGLYLTMNGGDYRIVTNHIKELIPIMSEIELKKEEYFVFMPDIIFSNLTRTSEHVGLLAGIITVFGDAINVKNVSNSELVYTETGARAIPSDEKLPDNYLPNLVHEKILEIKLAVDDSLMSIKEYFNEITLI